MPRRLELQTVDRHPDAERIDALITGTLQAIGGLASAFVIAGLLGWSELAIAPWILALSLTPAMVTIGRWYRRRRRESTIYLGLLPNGWRTLVESMAHDADEIARVARAAPDGPLRAHLVASAEAAFRTVRSVEADARAAPRRSSPHPEHADDAVALARLTASVRHIGATNAAVASRPLLELAMRTELIVNALEEADAASIGQTSLSVDSTNDR